MIKAKILLIFAAAILGGCADKRAFSGSSNSNTAMNSSVYQASRESTITSTANTAASSSNVGGGGNDPSLPMAQQVSLKQAETVQNQPVVTERKIIRNADLQLETDAPEQRHAFGRARNGDDERARSVRKIRGSARRNP